MVLNAPVLFPLDFGLQNPLLDHRLGDLHEARDVRALHVVEVAVLFRAVLYAGVVDRRHDLVQFGVDLLGRPVEFLRVLRHFEARRSHAAGIHGLARSVGNLRRDEGVDGLRAAAHVRDFGHEFHAVGQQPLGVLAVQFVLRGARHGDVDFDLPRLFACEELRVGEFFGIRLHHVVVRRPEFEHVGDLFGVEAVPRWSPPWRPVR